MAEKEQARLDHYLGLLKEIKGQVSDEQTAVRILGEVAKDERMQQIRHERESANAGPATQKQIDYLKSLGVKVKSGLTKSDASAMIDEALENGD